MTAAYLAINLGYASVAAALSVAWFRVSRRRPSEAERAAGAGKRVGLTVWDAAAEQWVRLAPGMQPGPGQITGEGIAEADALELLWLAPAYDPNHNAGCDRLRQAIRDEQQKGEQ